MKIGFLTAMKQETLPLAKHWGVQGELELQKFYELPGGDLLYICNIGRANASAAAALLISKGCEGIVNIGTCGCTYEDGVGSVLIPKQFLDGDFYMDLCSAKKYDSANLNKTTEYSADTVRIFTVSHFSTEPLDSKPYLVDMETYGVATICKAFRVPYLPIKVISDKADENATESFEENVTRVITRNVEKIMGIVEDFRAGKGI